MMLLLYFIPPKFNIGTKKDGFKEVSMAILGIYVKYQRGPVDLREMKIVQSTLFTKNHGNPPNATPPINKALLRDY